MTIFIFINEIIFTNQIKDLYRGLLENKRQTLTFGINSQDLPTFTQNIQRLMNDVNCYRAYNSLTPADAP